jgi:hypothetical protein
MSVFDVPRLHFRGVAVTRLPTGPRCGLLDLSRNQALTDDGPFPVDRPVQEYHDYLDRRGVQFDPDGRVGPNGLFSSTKGWNFGGNGHFWVDAKIVGCECAPGAVDTGDPVVGRYVDMWGHYNDYLRTTFNRARVFDIDPASNWTTAVMVGQFCFGRQGRSHDVGYMALGGVSGLAPPRWQNARYVLATGDHILAREFGRSVVYQFVVEKKHGLDWLDETSASAAATQLRSRVDSAGIGGLVVQFALSNMATPTTPDAPDFWDVRGTIAPWQPDELRTYPAGRLLSARQLRGQGASTPLHNMTVDVGAEHVTANMITAVPVETRHAERGPGPTHRLGPVLDVGDLELRTRRTDRLVARIPSDAYRAGDHDVTGGVVTVPVDPSWSGDPAEPLCLVGRPGGAERVELLTEEETTVQADQSCLFLEHPNRGTGEDFAVEVPLRSFVRGQPAAVDRINVIPFFNPRALPLNPRARAEDARCADVQIVEVRPVGLDGHGQCGHGQCGHGQCGHGQCGHEHYAPTCTVSTDRDGRGALTIRSVAGGAAQVLLLPEGHEPPCDPATPGSAALGYDNEDQLGYWPAVGFLSVRSLPDDWHLDELPPDQVTFDLLYREVFAYYELLYSFMKTEIFSLADQCKVATYPRLIWLMSDPVNKAKTFYMPPTRDMTEPKARLLRKFLKADEDSRKALPQRMPKMPRVDAITSRSQLYDALCEAVTIELAVMMQYLYAAWSIPVYGAGKKYVERGEWTARQLRLACGDGGETLRSGIRGRLLNVAYEEMIHFLVINNIIMAMGQPFHLPQIDFGKINNQLLVPLDLCLEGFGLPAVQRFMAIEQPNELTTDLAEDGERIYARPEGLYRYSSLSELYATIKEAIKRLPDLFIVKPGRGGGEHHLFMRESVNAIHPDYQLEVDDVASALFAIDFVTEHGEGNMIASVKPAEDSHFDTFRRISDLLMAEHLKKPESRLPPWSPAYPVMRNPTLYAGNSARDLVTDPEARSAMILFNRSYFLMAQLMVQHFSYMPDTSLRRSKLMNVAIDVMTAMMRPLAELTVMLPSGRPGRTAGPSFELEATPGYIARPDVAMLSISRRFEHLSAMADKCAGLPDRVPEIMKFYADYFRRLDPREL